MKKFVQPLISILLIMFSAGLIFLWEFYLNDRLTTTSVVVAAKDIEKNQLIKNSDIKTILIKSEHAVEHPLTNPKSIVGLESCQFVPKGNQIVDAMLDQYGLEPNSNQLIYSIPKEWIYSSPGSLRRKDKVYIYAIYDGKSKLNERPDKQIALSQGYQTVPKNVYAQKLTVSEPILKNLVVAYAKDSSNQEVKPATNSEKRLDATGAINNLELVMTQEQYSIMESKYLNGFRFNFAYR